VDRGSPVSRAAVWSPAGPLARVGRWLRREELALPLGALLCAAAEILALRSVWFASFGPSRRIPEAADLPLGHAVLWGLGLAGAVLAVGGSYRLLRRGRWWVAALVIPLVCFPLAVLALGSLYGSMLVAAIL
jgi:hypothetical protein